VTKVPDLLSYPIYTIIGSGQTQGVSYDKYVGHWGDISHRYLVAAGSNTKYDNSATFAEACGSNHSHSPLVPHHHVHHHARQLHDHH